MEPAKDLESSLDGIISYLTRKHGGNAQERELAQSLRSRCVMIMALTNHQRVCSEECGSFHRIPPFYSKEEAD
jgi:hypothetical protein